MSTAIAHLEAGGLLPPKTRADAGATEQIVARNYRHPALGDRPVIRLASDRLGQAEDLAMEFLGFEAPRVSTPVAIQQRRSLGFAAWALINDAKNARYALELVKRMKAAARQARSKPGHAWDAYAEMAKDLGRSARHFLPPFWEEVGRTFKDLGNQTYAGRALNKSLEAERVHALESDRARRRDVVLEFVLSGCLSGNALSEYSNDLQSHYKPDEAYAIFRDLCVRRTRGGMAPWATMPKDFTKLAKAAGLDGDQELEKWLEEVIDSPAMGRPPLQFWKTCSPHCKRIVARNPAFAVALLRHTRPEPRFYGDSKLGPWFELLEEWGVFDFLWEDEHRGAPPLGESIAAWFSRIVRDEVPAPKRTLVMLEKLAERLKKENVPLPLAAPQRYGNSPIDVDVLEACLVRGIKVDDPPPAFQITFAGWLTANPDHPLRNQDIVESWKDERFKAAVFSGLAEALACRGGQVQRGYRQANLEQRAFPLAAGDRPGIKELWRLHTSNLIDALEECGLASFETVMGQLGNTLWPDTIRLFPDLAERINRVDPTTVLQRTLRAGVFDEYGLPALEEVVDQNNIKLTFDHHSGRVIHLTFPSIVVTDKVHAYVVQGEGKVVKHELRLPKKAEITSIVVVGDDLAINYRDEKYTGHLVWISDPSQHYDGPYYGYYGAGAQQSATILKDGSVFLGQQAVRPGDKQMPGTQLYLHDGERFWRISNEYDGTTGQHTWKCQEVDPQTGKQIRDSVPAWFEETEGGTIELGASELLPAPTGSEESPLGTKNGLIGWKTIKRRDGSYFGVGIDGRRWDNPLFAQNGVAAWPIGLLRQPGTDEYLPVSTAAVRGGHYQLWDPTGSTITALLQDFTSEFAYGQVTMLPLRFWHLLKLRDEASSKKMRATSLEQCADLFKEAAKDRELQKGVVLANKKDVPDNPLPNLLPAVKAWLPTAPMRMVVGIARLIERAERGNSTFTAFREKAFKDSTKETKSSTLIVNRKSDVAAAQWGMRGFHVYTHEGEVSVSDHLSAVAEFLKGEAGPGELPRTNFLWYSMLENSNLACWQTFWRATAARMGQKEKADVPWLEFLKLWHELGIAELPGQIDLMEAVPEGAKKNNWGGYELEVQAGSASSFQNGDDKYISIQNDAYHHNELPYFFLRYSTADDPSPPPGFQVKNLRRIKTEYDPEEIKSFIAAVESAMRLPLPTKEELEELAGKLAASSAEVGLVWLGGLNLDHYQNHFLPTELRTTLGWKTTEANAGRQALRNLNSTVLKHLYESVVAHGCAAPFAEDRSPVLRSIEKAWQAKMPKRLYLEAALQTRLSALGRTSRWHHLNHEELLSIAADPGKHPLLSPREIEIKVEKDKSYGSLYLGGKTKNDKGVSADSLRSIVQLVALVHAETPAGHPARADMPALIKQVTKLLDHSSTLLDLRTLYIFDQSKKKPSTPSEWISKHVGKIKVNAKDGTARIDDGLITGAALDSQRQALIAFRPAKLKDERDLARLQSILTLEVEDERTHNDSLISLVAVIKSSGFQKLAKAIVSKDLPRDQWPQNPNHTAPDVVKAIAKHHKLDEEAATLYAQLLAVPDPTTVNVCTWNGWTAAQFKKAAAELVARKLVLEASRARAGRSIFLPGEWIELKSPWLPIESWKLSHLLDLDLDPQQPYPIGGPMVLRPFEDLFAAAWQRVLDGDPPRYEEVKRKKKATK